MLLNISFIRANAFAERLQLNIAVLHGEHIPEDSDLCDGRQSPPALRRRRFTSESGADCTVHLGKLRYVSFKRENVVSGIPCKLFKKNLILIS